MISFETISIDRLTFSATSKTLHVELAFSLLEH